MINKGNPIPDGVPVLNAFCPTGKGGGVDPTCGSGGGNSKTHSIKLPTTKTRLTIDQANAAMSEMGYKVGRGKFNFDTKTTSHTVTDPDGKEVTMTTKEIKKMVYAGVKK